MIDTNGLNIGQMRCSNCNRIKSTSINDICICQQDFSGLKEKPPKGRVIRAYNPVTGWFVTKWDDDLNCFPLYNWSGKPGIWYPAIEKGEEI